MPTNPYRQSEEGPGPVGYLALVCAWAVPGLGHLLLGERGRALVFGLTIHLLFGAGLILGGLHAINPPDQAIWTYTQFLAGWPMVVFNGREHDFDARTSSREGSQWEQLLHTYAENRPPPGPARVDYAKKFFAEHPLVTFHPKIQDPGAVYCGIAGMLNLLVMFDVLLRITGSQREDPNARSVTPAGKTVPDSVGGVGGAVT